MKKLFLILLVSVGFFRSATAQCPPNAFALISPYPLCSEGCVVLLKDWPEGVIVNIYGGSPLGIVASTLIGGTFGGPGTGDGFVCVPCNIPLLFASIVPGAQKGCVLLPLGTVPIKLTDFSVVSNDNTSCFIKWATSEEPGGTRYTLQRSIDSRSFSDLVTFIGKGKTINNYSYDDKSLPQGNLFYRIKITEVTGKIIYSETALLKNQSSLSISVYPNPAVNDFKISIPGQFLPASVLVYDVNGKVVHSVTTIQSTLTINKTLPKGVYALRITGKNNATATETLLIK